MEPAQELRQQYERETWYGDAQNCAAHIKPEKGNIIHCAQEECKWYAIGIFKQILGDDPALKKA